MRPFSQGSRTPSDSVHTGALGESGAQAADREAQLALRAVRCPGPIGSKPASSRRNQGRRRSQPWRDGQHSLAHQPGNVDEGGVESRAPALPRFRRARCAVVAGRPPGRAHGRPQRLSSRRYVRLAPQTLLGRSGLPSRSRLHWVPGAAARIMIPSINPQITEIHESVPRLRTVIANCATALPVLPR